MKLKIINSTDTPEELVCTAARNDYMNDGVIDKSFKEVMSDASVDESFVHPVADDLEYPAPENVDPDPFEDLALDIQLEVKKRTLLKHLMSDGHWGPFEHPTATVAIEGATRTAMAQLARHRHFTFDIMSLRYVQPDGDIAATPTEDDLEISREGVHDIDPHVIQGKIQDSYDDSVRDYETLVEHDVPKEEARKVLPMGTKVNIVMSSNARAWMHLLNIRGKANVQGEARRIAQSLMDEMKDWMPFTFEYYDEEVLPLQLNP